MAKTDLGIRVVGGFESDLMDAHLAEEDFHEANQVGEGQITVRDNALHLVELCQVCRVHGLVSEDAVDAEQLGGAEPIVLVAFLRNGWLIALVNLLPTAFRCQLVQHMC